ncbi:hypothetical protein C5167_046036 [Papaver somniferum]|uniref:Uncharacterized protein n=1 Tax=Papaver somniferum TaxID=3469 RepID=A0A4Y7LGA2_PAPSO|nr:hypothetical protein C5167_046036 [Papaver somniferum]
MVKITDKKLADNKTNGHRGLRHLKQNKKKSDVSQIMYEFQHQIRDPKELVEFAKDVVKSSVEVENSQKKVNGSINVPAADTNE